MFRISLTLVLLASLAAAAAPPPAFDDASLRAVQFVDDREGWAAGDDGVIWHSIDGGQTWERQKSGTRATLTGVHFLTPYTGFVSGRTELPGDLGSNGVLLATTDGGLTWTEIANGLLPGLNVVKFFDEKNGLVAGDSCGAYPGGAFTTADGGKSWLPVVGPLGGSWLAADCVNKSMGVLVGAWGKTATLSYGEAVPTDVRVPGARSVRALKSSGKTAFVVGDGCLVLVNRSYPNGDFLPCGMAVTGSLRPCFPTGTWEKVDLPLPPEARAVLDFHAVSVVGDNVWLAGRPGSVMLHSKDGGKTWVTQPTDSHVPLHAIQMLNATTGWAVGDLGTILVTTNGGQKWKHVRGKLHAAVLTAHASAKCVPLTLFPVVGAADGYLTATVAFTTADAATADPKRAADPFRLSSAIRLAGGAAAETLSAFPLPGHCDGLPADQLRAYWDHLHDGHATEQLVRQMTLAIRLWRPEVIVTDSVMPNAPAAEQLILATAQEAFKRAADPIAYPEQIATLGLKVHAAKKLYGRSYITKGMSEAEEARFARGDLSVSEWEVFPSSQVLNKQFREAIDLYLVSHRLSDAEAKQKNTLMTGIALAWGGMARRDNAALGDAIRQMYSKPDTIWNREHMQFYGQITSADSAHDPTRRPVTPTERWQALQKRLNEFHPIETSELTAGLTRMVDDTMGRELHQYAVDHHPTQLASLPSYRWLMRYHASTELLRRIELGQVASLRPTEFYEMPKGDLQQVGFVEGAATERAKFRSSEVQRDWFNTGLRLEGKLFAVNPLLAREPGQQLAFNAARLKMGLTADAEKAMAAYYRAVVGKTATAGANPWFDAMAAELHLMNRTLMPACPKPVAACAKIAARPVLDGKLDDAVWAGTTELPLGEGPKDLAATHGTTARLAFDDEYLYLGVTCRHPNGEQVPLADARKHDDDVAPHDRVELLLDLDRDYATYYRLRVDHRGCTADDCWGDSSWNPQWFVAVNPTPTGWTAEVAIPLAELTGSRPRDKSVWAANVVRVVPGRGVLSWSGPADATPRPEGMGLLEFRAK